MIHIIKNQMGNHIIDYKIRQEILHTIDHDMTHTYYEGDKIEIVSDVKTDKERVTLVHVSV